MILPFHQRMAELYIIEQGSIGRQLTAKEVREMEYCQRLNAEYACEMATLSNHSLMAHMTDDIEWQHKICQQMEELGYKDLYTKKRSNAQEHPTKE